MAEAILFGMAGNILSELSTHAVQQIGSSIGIKKELKKLENTLSTINAVLMDADEQHLDSHEMRDWLKKIKDACYEADDVLDDFAIEALRQEMRIGASNFKKVWRFAYSVKSVSFCLKMSRKVKNIREKFDDIAADKKKFHLTVKSVDKRTFIAERVQSHSFVVDLEVFGRDGDKEKIIQVLSDVDERPILAIIGIGGLGKTTLAQLVYNDKRVDGMFQSKMWVGVYQDFDVRKLTKKIVKSLTNQECPELEIDQLRSLLQEILKGKRFLLVLDDVWNEDNEKWDKFRFLMSSGAKGSKVVVTTRSSKAASVMGAIPFMLKELSYDDCWCLFKQRAFAMGVEEAHQNFIAIGKDIVKKCGGVPLAAKALGSLMRFKSEEHEWLLVKDNDVWRLPQKENGILPALRLSFDQLPFHLKQCFAYCSIYPKDHRYMKNNLINSWIAQDFVRSSSVDNQLLEDAGNEYVKEMLWRSFFQEPEEDDFGNIISFKMHELVHNLARDVARTEYLIFEKGAKVQNHEGIRHLNFFQCSQPKALKALSRTTSLRSLAFSANVPDGGIFSRFRYLRALSLDLVTGTIPCSIGKLKHLRILILESNVIQFLPKSITKLQNLQTLDITCCPNIRRLPKDIGKMINLRHIYLAKDAPVSHTPPGLQNLSSLQTLSLFVVGDGIGCKLNELHRLKDLKGQLVIRNLENVSSSQDCATTSLSQKMRLDMLKLSWDDGERRVDVSKEEKAFAVLEHLQPHSHLRSLKIRGYGASRFPYWMRKPLFPILTEISLVSCKRCQCLPPFGQLPSLKSLKLKDMDVLQFVEGSVDKGQREWFPSLKKLMLKKLPNLENWVVEETSGVLSLPYLVQLTIIECPNLRKMPLLPSLEELKVICCSEKLVHSLFILPEDKSASASLAHLKSLKIQRCDDLVSLAEDDLLGLVSLEEMYVMDCPRLVDLATEVREGSTDGTGYLTSLKWLEISKLPNLVSLPQWIQNSAKLQGLSIMVCEGLIDFPDSFSLLTSLQVLSLVNCSKLKLLPDGMHHLTELEELAIVKCDSLISWPNGLGNLTSLKVLAISCSSNLPFLPEQLEQLTALKRLGIFNCQTLSTLPEWLVNFTSLQDFSIYTLRNLQYFPEWMPNLSVLQRLEIYECDILTSRCKKGLGEDWLKIAHVPNIQLDYEWLQQA